MKKNRLKKKAADDVILYHGASSDVFLKIIEDGMLDMSGNVDNKSFISDSYLDAGDRRKNANNVVFLGTGRGARWYATNFTNMTHLNNSPDYAFGVMMKLRVDKDALGPDLNDGQIDRDSDVPLWKQTLDSIGQCVHYGPIYIDRIESVEFVRPNSWDEYDFDSHETHIEFKEEMSLDEAYETVTSFYEEITKLNDPNTKLDGLEGVIQSALDEIGVQHVNSRGAILMKNANPIEVQEQLKSYKQQIVEVSSEDQFNILVSEETVKLGYFDNNGDMFIAVPTNNMPQFNELWFIDIEQDHMSFPNVWDFEEFDGINFSNFITNLRQMSNYTISLASSGYDVFPMDVFIGELEEIQRELQANVSGSRLKKIASRLF